MSIKGGNRPLLLLIVLGAACGSLRPRGPAPVSPPATFSNENLDRVLARVVDERGRVDYDSLRADPIDLDRYHALIAAVSPDSDPGLFATREARLAYWINAHNAAVLELVLAHYPIASVHAIRPPLGFFWLTPWDGFFFQRVVLGGRAMTLRRLENEVIRKRFADPRVHFALTFASRGGSRLPRHAFSAEQLDEELDRETRRFVAEPCNLAIDLATRSIFVSSIFKWYRKDFLDWEARRARGRRPTLPGFIAPYLSAEARFLVRACSGCAVRFLPYDWRLNVQHPRG